MPTKRQEIQIAMYGTPGQPNKHRASLKLLSATMHDTRNVCKPAHSR